MKDSLIDSCLISQGNKDKKTKDYLKIYEEVNIEFNSKMYEHVLKRRLYLGIWLKLTQKY